MAGREHDPIPSITGKTQPLCHRSAGVEDRPRADLDRPGARLAVDRRSGGILDQVEHPVQRDAVLQTGEPELLVRVAVEQPLRVPADVVQRVRGPTGYEPGEQRPFEFGPGHAARSPRRPIQHRKSADVSFDNVGGHLSASLGEEIRWSFETRWS
jgi:hypothetical protein